MNYETGELLGDNFISSKFIILLIQFNSINQQNGNEKDVISAISLANRLSKAVEIFRLSDHALRHRCILYYTVIVYKGIIYTTIMNVTNGLVSRRFLP